MGLGLGLDGKELMASAPGLASVPSLEQRK